MKYLLSFLLFCGIAHAQLIVAGDSQPSVRAPLVASDTFCYKMASALGATCTNLGVGGNTSSDLLARFSTVTATPGTCVIIQIGANDAAIAPNGSYDFSSYWTSPQPSAVSVAQYTANLTQMVILSRAAGKEPVFMTPWAFFSSPDLVQFPFYVNAMIAVGAQMGVPVLDAYRIQTDLWWASKPWLTQNAAPSLWDLEADYQHPNAAGHTLEANLCQKPQNSGACACH